MANETIEHAKQTMIKTEEALSRELGNIRAGRANGSLLNRITVDYYGAPTPLNQLAAITVPEARVLMVTPYDKGALKDIEAAINMSDLGINPANDGSVIRLVIPQLTGERRKELAKEVGKYAENAKIAVRNIRRDALDSLKKQQKAAEITEDELHKFEKDVQKVTDDATKRIDEIAAAKEKEITEG
ncbi:ribosome recycling factor [Lacticaseibacillus brantae]|uniref:Ribosome-recycling factor n=1 Tax=Lacticaseibacillus brantae DSM 23927 TaxID=1423727 RepID=A0A0R2AZR5_9LACO|nr:ribosome recycling factor [Lacticaseibacillus brantae]KRM72766.1 Ribosome recycling factor [Lacticaseibacillus brantae DSM 23927]